MDIPPSLLTDFVCLYTYEFQLSLWKIVRSSVILILPLFISFCLCKKQELFTFRGQQCSPLVFGGIRVAHHFSFLCS
jgi:hypothetical protein